MYHLWTDLPQHAIANFASYTQCADSNENPHARVMLADRRNGNPIFYGKNVVSQQYSRVSYRDTCIPPRWFLHGTQQAVSGETPCKDSQSLHKVNTVLLPLPASLLWHFTRSHKLWRGTCGKWRVQAGQEGRRYPICNLSDLPVVSPISKDSSVKTEGASTPLYSANCS